MLTIFNRRELITTFSLEEQSKLRTLLSAHNIPYTIKLINRNSPSAFSDTRARTGSLGQKMSLAYEYRFYVLKKDLSFARSLLGLQ